MLGVVLCGGMSLRMGADKGLLIHQDRLWAKIANDKLESLNIPTVYSINERQLEAYSSSLGNERLVLDQPDLEISGPLLGVLSAHLDRPEENLFFLACDMLLMESSLLSRVLDAYLADSSYDAYIFKKDGQLEPLCGIYKNSGLKKIISLFDNSRLEKHSMKYVLSKVDVFELKIGETDHRYFLNANSHSQINGL